MVQNDPSSAEIRELRDSERRRHGVTSSADCTSQVASPRNFAERPRPETRPSEQSSAPRATLLFTLGAGVTPAARRAGDYYFVENSPGELVPTTREQ